MRAALVREYGNIDAIDIAETSDLTPEEGQVRIDVAAASINFPDVLVVEGKYQNLPPTPFSPGKEAVGRIGAVGAGVDEALVGQRVLALVEHGAYAEQLCVDAEHVVPVPDGVSNESAAALGLVASTAHLALFRRGRLSPGETVLVTGAGGGVGSVAVQLAKAHGARVIALAQDAERAEVSRNLGADVVLTSSAAELREDIMQATDGRGADLVVEVLGGQFLTQVIRSTAWEGRIVIVGFAVGDQELIKPGHILVKNIALLGLQSSDYLDRSPADVRKHLSEVLSLAADKKLDAGIAATYPLSEITRGLRDVSAGTLAGKAVVTIDA